MDSDKLIEDINIKHEEPIKKTETDEKVNLDKTQEQQEIKNINIWESKFTKYCTFFNTYEEFINYIKENKHTKIIIHEKQNPEDHDKSQLDFITRQNNISITYTDKQHPITILNFFENDTPDILINPIFFEKYKNQLKEDIKKIIIDNLKTNPNYIYIPNIVIDEELANILLSSNELDKTYINFYDLTNDKISESITNKLKESHLYITYEGKKISTNKAISHYTFKELENAKSLQLYDTLTDEELKNFTYINPNSTIKIVSKKYKNINEYIYFNNLKRIFEILKTHNKTYNIQINVENRELLKQSNLLNYQNINLIIKNDLYEYSKEEYLKEEEQLEKLIKPIKEANLSPYEKYLAVYNIVKQFKPYKENKENSSEARYLRYILNNEYMVCVGYAKLLKTLLDKVEIPSIEISVGIDTSYDKGFTMENIPTKIAGHARNIIKINDDKYNIHGIFISDPTWDNNLEKDLYNNSSMTFDQKKEAKRLETLTDEDLLLDFHNLNNFSEKINFYLRRKIKKSFSEKHTEKIIDAYLNAYENIMNLLLVLDYNKYLQLHKKYNESINDINYNKYNSKAKTLKEIENIFSDFLTEYATYIIPLSNKKIDTETLLNAANNTKKEINKYNKEKLQEWLTETKKSFIEKENKSFPYSYDPNNETPNYLETKKR